MKDGAVLANAGHFDVEIDLADLRELAGGRVREVLPLVEQYEVGDRRLNLLASGRVVNLAAGEGHPAAVMDMSFANLALAVEHLALHGDELERRVLDVPKEIDEEIARLKLESLGVEIDALTPDQQDYLSSWGAEVRNALDPAGPGRGAEPAIARSGRAREEAQPAWQRARRSPRIRSARKRSSSTRSPRGPEGIGDRHAAVDLDRGPELVADLGDAACLPSAATRCRVPRAERGRLGVGGRQRGGW